MASKVSVVRGFGPLVSIKGHVYRDPDLVETKIVSEAIVKGDGSDKTNYVIKRSQIEASRISRQDYIDSFADEVGVINVLRKVAKTGDTSLVNQIGEVPVGNQDLTNMPTTPGGAYLYAKSLEDQYHNLTPELKGNMTLEEFMNKATNQYIDSYIEKKLESMNKTKDTTKVEGGTNNG